MKKSYTLLITLSLVVIFAFLSSQILEKKSLQNINLQNQYLYIQAKNHKNFLKEYLQNIDLKNVNYFEIYDERFLIYAKIKEENKKHITDIFVKSKEKNISVYERIIIE